MGTNLKYFEGWMLTLICCYFLIGLFEVNFSDAQHNSVQVLVPNTGM